MPILWFGHIGLLSVYHWNTCITFISIISEKKTKQIEVNHNRGFCENK